MNRFLSIVWVVACVVFGACLSALAQTERIDRGTVSFERFAFQWETHLVPPTPPLAPSFGAAYARTGQNLVHRMLIDRGRRVYFGYSVQIEALPERTMFRLSFQPLVLSAGLRAHLGADADEWKQLASPTFSGPRTVRAGEVLELNLLMNEAWGQRLKEYVTVQEAARPEGFGSIGIAPREFAFASGAPREFTLEDINLRLQEPRVFINGRFDDSTARTIGDEMGSVVWIYIPTRGRFVFSVVPRERLGFRRAGEIRGSTLRFTVNGDTYTVNSGGRIAPGSAAFNLYVLHQPAWRPTYPNANIDVAAIGAADRAEFVATK